MNEPNRTHLPETRPSLTHHGVHTTSQGSRMDFYVTVGFYDTPGRRADPGEVFVTIAKEGSDLRRFINGWAIMVSMALQSGVPWGKIRDKFATAGERDVFADVVAAVDLCVEARGKIIGEDEPVVFTEAVEPEDPVEFVEHAHEAVARMGLPPEAVAPSPASGGVRSEHHPGEPPVVEGEGTFTIKLTYFNERGKYKYEGEVPDQKWQGEGVDISPGVHAVVKALRDEVKAGNAMPGLKGCWYAGPILVELPGHPHDHPHLIMPK